VLDQVDALAHLKRGCEVAGLDIEEVVVPESKHLLIDGLRLHYLDWGNRSSTPLIFLHGGCLTAHTWDLVCLALRDDYHCLALDLRGHGDSQWSATLDYRPQTHVRDLAGLIDALRLVKPVLVGHSLGGLVSVNYAGNASERLGGVVVVDVGPQVRDEALERLADFVLHEPSEGSLEDFVGRAIAFAPGRDRRLLKSSLLHNLKQLPSGTWTWKYDRRRLTPEYFQEIRAHMAGMPTQAPLITCPVLVIRGGKSRAHTDEDAADFAQAFPQGRCRRVENAGHNVQADNPVGLVAALREFLAGDGLAGRLRTATSHQGELRG
jgi:esterase